MHEVRSVRMVRAACAPAAAALAPSTTLRASVHPAEAQSARAGGSAACDVPLRAGTCYSRQQSMIMDRLHLLWPCTGPAGRCGEARSSIFRYRAGAHTSRRSAPSKDHGRPTLRPAIACLPPYLLVVSGCGSLYVLDIRRRGARTLRATAGLGRGAQARASASLL